MMIMAEAGKELSETEKTAVDYINRNSAKIGLLSISEVAEGAFVSTATVSRAVRKCGFQNFTEMKLSLSKEEPHSYLINEILSKSYTECVKTIEGISIDQVLSVVEQLRKAKRIYLVALGLTALVAEEFEFQLQCQKYNVCTVSDNEMLRRMDKLAEKDDLIIILSVRNTSPDLYTAAKLGKKAGAAVVTVCCRKDTDLEKISDITLIGYSQVIRPNSDFGSTSRLGLFIITRTIIEYLMAGVEK